MKKKLLLNQITPLRSHFIGSGHCHRQYHSPFPPSTLPCCSNSPTATTKELFLSSLVDVSYYALSCWHFISKSHFRNKSALLLPLVPFPVANTLILSCHYMWCCKDMMTRPWKRKSISFLKQSYIRNCILAPLWRQKAVTPSAFWRRAVVLVQMQHQLVLLSAYCKHALITD